MSTGFNMPLPDQDFGPRKPRHSFAVFYSNVNNRPKTEVLVCVCETRELADKIAFSMEPNGFKNQYTRIADVALVRTWDEYVAGLPETIKRRALNKLTPEEKAALGLTQG